MSQSRNLGSLADVAFYDGTSVMISCSINSSGSFTSSSDRNLKENIVTIDNALEKTLSLRGVYYNRKDLDDKSRKIGVIAQEVDCVLPEVVNREQQHLDIEYGNIVAVLIEAIKEQQKQIDELKTIINSNK